MAVTFKRLATGQLTTTADPQYTATGVNAQIDAISVTNNHTSAVSVSIWGGTGGSAADANILIKAREVAAGASVAVYEAAGQVIPDGGSLFASASVAGVVTLVASGREQTVE
jgi:hypothetical protein